MQDSASLEKLKLWVQIVSSIAVPVTVLIVGNMVQKAIADQEISKSYVQMAVEVLRTQPTPETEELRQWAVATVDRYSPLPLSKNLRDQLKQGRVELSANAVSVSSGKANLTAANGIVKYLKCEKVRDVDTAHWMIQHAPNRFQKCPKEDEVGIAQFKRQDGPLREGESLLSSQPEVLQDPVKLERSVQCVKAVDVAAASWMLQNYGQFFFKCAKGNEVGIEAVKMSKK